MMMFLDDSFHWIKVDSHHQTTVQTSAATPNFYDLLPRQKITAGDKVRRPFFPPWNNSELVIFIG